MFNELADAFSMITYDKYLYTAVLLILFIAILKFALYFTKKYLMRLAKKTATEIDDQIIMRAERPVFLTLVIAAIEAALMPLELKEPSSVFVNNMLNSLLVISVAYTIYVITSVILEHYVRKINKHTASSFHSEVIPFANHFSKIIYAIIALVVILNVWDVNVVPLLAGLGIAGLTIGLALQNTLMNVIGGISILLDKNFSIGDEIRLDNDIEGTILDVGLRSTKLRTKNNELIIIPNNLLASSRITNYAKPSTNLRIGIEFSVKPGEDIARIARLLENRSRELVFVDHSIRPELSIISITDNQLRMTAYFWINLAHAKRTDARDRLSMVVYDAVRARRR